MKEKLENLPLFNGRRGKQNYDFDFSLNADSILRDVIFSLNFNTVNEMKTLCELKDIKPSDLVEALVKNFIAENK